MENNPPPELFSVIQTLNCRGRLISLEIPRVMGILNLTPDSFSDGGKFNSVPAALAQVEKMLTEGATFIDIGAYSSRPGAQDISVQEELDRLGEVVTQVLAQYPEALISIDTFRAPVAKAMLELGAHLINDIGAGLLDEQMFTTVAAYDAPYVFMHMQGTPQTMQQAPAYTHVVEEVTAFLVERMVAAQAAGIHDLVLDPGFGFGKTLAHNYELFRNLGRFKALGVPVLIGISRKSMIYRPFGTEPNDVLELTTALHLKAVEAGVKILRTHDVRPAARAIQLHQLLSHGAI